MATAGVLALVFITACSGGAGDRAVNTNAPRSGASLAPAPPVSVGLTSVVASSELTVGANRFTIGIQDRQQQPIPDAVVHLKFFQLNGLASSSGSVQATLRSEADAVFRAPAREAGLPQSESVVSPDGKRTTVLSVGPDVGVYAATVNFDATGSWAVEADVAGKTASQSGVVRTRFTVLAQAQTPAIGTAAPRSHNLTVNDVKDLSLIDTSAHPARDMHTETIADSIAAHHPLLVLFATPGYCQSRFCGPELEIARKLESQYLGKADFIHVEIWQDPLKVYMPAVLEWHLPSEPWFFIVDAHGDVSAKFEGPTTMEELAAALNQVTQP
ncbi:MAG: hypothetical protein ACYDCQ_10540 [Dehalococcoidia bacterium]